MISDDESEDGVVAVREFERLSKWSRRFGVIASLISFAIVMIILIVLFAFAT
jgi:uncharacterized membrane protein (DUF485 family)